MESEPSGTINRSIGILSDDLGLIHATSYGARTAKKAVRVSLFAEGTFYLYYNPVRHTYTLNDADIESWHEAIRGDLESNYTAMFFCEMIARTVAGDARPVRQLLSGALVALESGVIDRNQTLIQFIWNLIDLLGFRPDMQTCPSCGRSYGPDEILGFSLTLTAPCCQTCATVDTGMLLPPGARRYLTYTSSMSFGQAVGVQLSPAARKRIKTYLLEWAQLICGSRPLKTLEGSILQDMV